MNCSLDNSLKAEGEWADKYSSCGETDIRSCGDPTTCFCDGMLRLYPDGELAYAGELLPPPGDDSPESLSSETTGCSCRENSS